MMAVAWRKIAAGLCNTDDRLAGLQFVPGQSVVEVALKIERRHRRIMRVVKPLAGTEFAPGGTGYRLVHRFSRTAHALFLCVMFVLAGNLGMSTVCPQRLPERVPPTTLIQRHYQKILVRPPANNKGGHGFCRMAYRV
jgi:hypothetical protein